jgi:exodeoxyribonuclease III
VKIATWNVNSLRARQDAVLDWLEKNRPDVLCMQETKLTDQEFPEDELGDLNYDVVYFGQRAYNGVAIASRPEMFEVVRGFPGAAPDADRRLIAATIEGIRIVGVYAPNGQAVGSPKYDFKLSWYQALRRWLEDTSGPMAPLLVCGDFNVAPNDEDVFDPLAMRGQILFSDPERAALRELMAFGLFDALRHVDQRPKRFTWWDYRAGSWERNLGLRIDHLLLTRPLIERIKSVTIFEEERGRKNPSDHVPVMVELT